MATTILKLTVSVAVFGRNYGQRRWRSPTPYQLCLVPPPPIQHNDMVRFRANAWLIVPALLLGGCGAPAHRNANREPSWTELNTVVSSSPAFPIGGPIAGRAPDAVPPHAVNNAPPPTQPTDTWAPLPRWCRNNGFGAPNRLTAASLPSYAISSTNGSFVLRPGTRIADWDGVEIRLGFAPQLIDGQPYVHTLDLNKTIAPLLHGNSLTSLASAPTIVIDPGHGGENAGTKSVLGNHYEKEFTLDWALRLRALLIANNCKVFLTRANDSDLALSNRVAFAEQHKADLFLSLHFNSAAPNEVEAGLETYCLTPAGMPSTLTRGFPDDLHQSFPNNAFDAQNLGFALRVHRALLQVNGHRDRGVRRARFPGVLRGQQRPAILVEAGYLSNPQEARQIEDPGYRQKLAEAVVKALLPTGSINRQMASQRPPTAEPSVAEPGTNAQVAAARAAHEPEATPAPTPTSDKAAP